MTDTTSAAPSNYTAPRLWRPGADEFAPYYSRYIDRIAGDDIFDILRAQMAETRELLATVPEERGGYRYAPVKWTLREALVHMGDTERIMAYRALRISRGDQTPLPGFEQDDFVPNSGAESRTVRDIALELEAIRLATLALFEPMTAEMITRRGTASGNPVTVRALAFIIAGHERHHLGILRERYL